MTININRLIRSKRRTIALIVERDGSVTVRAPLKMSAKAIEEFVVKHADWVEKKQIEVANIAPEKTKQYEAGERFLFLGQEYPLEIVKSARKKLVLEDAFKLAESEKENAEAVFRHWYRKQAAKIILERVALFAERYQLAVGTIRITSARTRWGSCSPKNNLSFSWRLVLTPPDVIDYVVIHELAHTVHHNHSKRFWKLVEKWMPDYKERRKQLRTYGKEIM
ncbi:MAG: SprT family zinc-dependent metalloprotease [Anaerolineales bacterium]